MKAIISKPYNVVYIICALVLVIFNSIVYGGNLGFSLLYSVSTLALLGSVILYNSKLNTAILLVFISELIMIPAAIITGNTPGYVETVLAGLAMIGMIIRERKNIKAKKFNIFADKEPFKLNKYNSLLFYILVITSIFIQATQNMKTAQISLLGTTYLILPVISVLMMIPGIKDVQYIRLFQFISWAIILQQANSLQLVPSIQIIEPVIYIIATVTCEMVYINKQKGTKVKMIEEKS